VCGVEGHALVGTDVARLRPEDAVVARDIGERRWHRCVRCDSWLPLHLPEHPAREHMPERDEIKLPLRGRPLRDKIVLRLIAIDRAFHFVVLAVLAVAIFLLAAHQASLRDSFYRVLADLQGGLGGPSHGGHSHFVDELRKLFSLKPAKLRLVGGAVALYAVIEGLEAVGLWYQRRWAEYLTFIATTLLIPVELYELSIRVTPFKVVALIVNIAVVVYLLFAKRLFGLRGGAAAEEALRARDVGWEALERTSP
jgi:uncharacterized membrane protein (DUF2068 family)